MTDFEKASEDLQVVKGIMESCARRQADDGVYFKIWGILIPAATTLNIVVSAADRRILIPVLWGVTMLAGCVLSVIVSLRASDSNRRNMGSRLQTAVWISCWLSIVLVTAIGMGTGILPVNGAMFFIAVMMATAVFISGTLSGSRMLQVVAAGWWITGTVCAFLPEQTAPLLIGYATFFFNFIREWFLSGARKKE